MALKNKKNEMGSWKFPDECSRTSTAILGKPLASPVKCFKEKNQKTKKWRSRSSLVMAVECITTIARNLLAPLASTFTKINK